MGGTWPHARGLMSDLTVVSLGKNFIVSLQRAVNITRHMNSLFPAFTAVSGSPSLEEGYISIYAYLESVWIQVFLGGFLCCQFSCRHRVTL